MRPATYDELLDAGLVCPDTPHNVVYTFMTTLHQDPLPEASNVENNPKQTKKDTNMSSESFLLEFYPKPAIKAINTITEAADHSYNKWLGRLPKNLTKHNCQSTHHTIYSKDRLIQVLHYGENTCSLCQWSKKNNKTKQSHCHICPLTIIHGSSCDEGDNNIYIRSRYEYPPTEMIELLHKVRMFVRLNEIPRTASWCSSPIME